MICTQFIVKRAQNWEIGKRLDNRTALGSVEWNAKQDVWTWSFMSKFNKNINTILTVFFKRNKKKTKYYYKFGLEIEFLQVVTMENF